METDYILDYGVLSAEGRDQLYLVARIRASASHEGAERSPLNMGVVLDRSGSMHGVKLKYVKEAAQFLVRHLDASDRFNLVAYDTTVSVIVPPTRSSHKDQMTQAIQRIESGGGTNLSGGWLRGCQLVAEGIAGGRAMPKFNPFPAWLSQNDEKSLSEAQINRVLLLTDGLANQGVTDLVRLVQMARHQREEGVPTTTIGVGLQFNEDLLVQMASEGGGNFYFIDNPDQIPQIFANELQTLLGVVAQNLVVSLVPKSNARFVRQLNTYPSDSSDGAAVFRLGDLTGGETKTLVLELAVPDLPGLGEVEIAQLRFEYDELQDERALHRVVEMPVMVNVVAETDFSAETANPDVMRDVLRLQAGLARRDAIKLADMGQFKAASDRLNHAADSIEQSDIVDDDLQAEHDMLREEAIDMDIGAERYDSYTRKTSTTSSHHTSQLGGTTETGVLYHRLRDSRQAMERNGTTPTQLKWKKETLDLTMDTLTFGRAEDNDVVVDDVPVSRYHCRLVREGEHLFLEDLGSTNGTYANRGRVESRFRVSEGDVMTIGTWLFMFRG